MNKYELTKRIENFAPLETQEPWDCSGWAVDALGHDEISKVMLCLTVTDDVVKQAKENNCDMIISHHPLFFVPFSYLQNPSTAKAVPLPLTREAMNIYCAHTNLDLAQGGTTDWLIRQITNLCHCGEDDSPTSQSHHNEITTHSSHARNDISFLRYLNFETSIDEFIKILKPISPNLRYVNNKNTKIIHKIAFCAGSGAEFIDEAYSNGADALVTGDIKFHTALESPIVLFDIGHFESEIGVLKVFENLINNDVEVIFAQEKSPFNYQL